MHVIVAYESKTEKLRSVHLAKNLIKKKPKSVKEQEFCLPSGLSFSDAAFLSLLCIFNSRCGIFMCEEGGGCYRNLTILYKLIHTSPTHKVQ